MNNIKFNPILEEYLTSLNLLDEVKTLIDLSIKQNEKKWKQPEITELNLAFDWDLPNRGFDFWDKINSEFSTFRWTKQLKEFSKSKDISPYISLVHPPLAQFLIANNCLPQYIINCVTFISEYGNYLESPTTVEEHIRSRRDIINAFRCSTTPEGKEFWRDINEKFIVYSNNR